MVVSCAMPLPGTKFESQLQVRPDDIDMNRHVHASRYMDYVLAARYDQMSRCYGIGMEEFTRRGYAWFVRSAHLEYKRPLGLEEQFMVKTWVDEIGKDSIKVAFEIVKVPSGKLCADGNFGCTMVNAETGRAETIPDWIVAKYSI